jgi:hypothetical protein
LLQDIHSLLKKNDSPADRFGLQLVEIGVQRYWKIGR